MEAEQDPNAQGVDAAEAVQAAQAAAPPDGASTAPEGDHLRFAFDNPLSDLPVVARRLLLAAKQIVATQGFDALSLNSISEVSGENKAMISYYFGGKSGLIAAVLDSVIHDEYLVSVARMRDVEPGERLGRMIDEMRSMTESHEEFRVFFELLPVALRNDMLRARMVRLYEWYWSEKLGWLGVSDGVFPADDPDILGLAQLLSAVIDGIAIQTAIDPDRDPERAYAVLAKMIEGTFPQVFSGETVAGSEASPALRTD